MKLIKQFLKYLKGLFINIKTIKTIKTKKVKPKIRRRPRSTYHRIRISKMIKRK